MMCPAQRGEEGENESMRARDLGEASLPKRKVKSETTQDDGCLTLPLSSSQRTLQQARKSRPYSILVSPENPHIF